MTPGMKVFDKLSKREGTVVGLIGPTVCIIQTVDNVKFTQKVKLLTRIEKFSETDKTKFFIS